MNKTKILSLVVNTCRLLVSTTFVFSGVVKLIDPVGFRYKIDDYLAALGVMNLAESIWPLMLAVGISIVEFLLGIYLLFGIRRRLTSWSVLLFMLVYTPLTLWLALTDKVADCGCFGDAVHLTNWQTFGKNAALLLAAFVIWHYGRLMTRFISESVQWLVSLYSLLYALFVAGLCLVNEPIIDFRPYHIGQHLPTAMQCPDDPAATPEILDFSFFPIDGLADVEADVTPPADADELLADTSYTFLLVSPHLELADDGTMDRINVVYDYARRHAYPFLALTGSGPEAISRWQDLTGAEYPFAFMDELTLKTIARSNPALVLLHDGSIVAKWPASRIPVEAFQLAPLYAMPLAHPQTESHRRSLLRLMLWYLLPLIALTLVDRFVFSLRWWHRHRRKTLQNPTDTGKEGSPTAKNP